MIVATDHPHYIEQECYSPDTRDFDFRHGRSYLAATQMVYRTQKPHGPPISLEGSYDFKWRDGPSGLRYMLLEIMPNKVA
jgi:hypothetical protein